MSDLRCGDKVIVKTQMGFIKAVVESIHKTVATDRISAISVVFHNGMKMMCNPETVEADKK
jgi:hypothetical protein